MKKVFITLGPDFELTHKLEVAYFVFSGYSNVPTEFTNTSLARLRDQ